MNHEKTGEGMKDKVFICFAAEDRYEIVEPIVYHLMKERAECQKNFP